MSLETLKNDLKLNMAELAQLDENLATPKDVVRHLKGSLWPTLDAIVEELDEVDSCVADIVDGIDEILTPESAGVFSAVIAGCSTVLAALESRVTRAQEPELFKVIDELKKNMNRGTEILADVVVGESEDDYEDDEDDEEDDDEQEDA